MTRDLPSRRVSSAWPSALLILWAPVWLEVLALEVQPQVAGCPTGPALQLRGQPIRPIQRGGTTDEPPTQLPQLRPERGLVPDRSRTPPRARERRHERLGHVSTAELALPPPSTMGVGVEDARDRPAGARTGSAGRSSRAARARLTNIATRTGSLGGRPVPGRERLDAARRVDADGRDCRGAPRPRSRRSSPPARMTGMRPAIAAATSVAARRPCRRAPTGPRCRAGSVHRLGFARYGLGPRRSPRPRPPPRPRVPSPGRRQVERLDDRQRDGVERLGRLGAVELDRVQPDAGRDRGHLRGVAIGEDAHEPRTVAGRGRQPRQPRPGPRPPTRPGRASCPAPCSGRWHRRRPRWRQQDRAAR